MAVRIIATFLYICLVSLVSGAQQNDARKPGIQYEISGKITESGFNQGLGGVAVTLERYEGEYTSSLTPRKWQADAETDDTGSFRFAVTEPGHYRVNVRKEGYSAAGSILDGVTSGITISLDQAHPKRDLGFQLARPVQLSGVVVNRDTLEPLQSHPVHAHGYAYQRGRVTLLPGATGFTDSQGRFTLAGISPGDYVISLGPGMHSAAELQRSAELRASGQDRLLTKFTDSDLSAVDLDYDWTYFPGGAGLEEALPLKVGSGAELDLGRLQIRKTTMYRARVDIPAATCLQNESVSVNLRRLSNPWTGTTIGRPPCGGGFLIRGLPPGAYRLELSAAGANATSEFAISDRNIAVTVPLERGVMLEGKVRTEGSTALDLSQIALLLKPLTWVVTKAPARLDADGRFRVEGVTLREYQLLINGIPASHCLRGVIYNGTRLNGDVLPLNPYALEHKVELVVDDQAATVTGTVLDGDRPVATPWVVLSPWAPQTDVYAAVLSMAGDEDGRFRFAGLPPGDYRIVAVPAQARRELERPNVLEQLLGSARKVSLGGKQTQALQVKVAAPPKL
jgi:hypothetical protein